MSKQGEEHAAIGFIKTLFGYTTESVYVCSLPNDKGDDSQAPERSICDRDAATITTFLNRWDQQGRGCFVGMATLRAGARRQKLNAVETFGLWVDIDFKSIVEDERTAEKRLNNLRCLPNLLVRSGHGLHCYWLFKEPLDTQADIERIEAALRLLADTLGGDLQVAQVVALMRLPGTHNTKGGEHWLVESTGVREQRYELDDIEEWLAEQSPLLTRKVRPKPPEQNPYLAIAESLGFKPPIDVEERLAAMVYQGEGDRAVHATQLAVTASLIRRGVVFDEVVSTVLAATRAAAGDYGTRWNWRREEINIRKMCTSWLGKIEVPRQARQEAVVNIATARAARKPAPVEAPVVEPKAKKFHPIARTTMAALVARGEDVLFEGKMCWRYVGNVWAIESNPDEWLDGEIEQTCVQLSLLSDNRLVTEARKFIRRQPALKGQNVMWDSHGMVPTLNGLVDPVTLELTPARADHRVTWRVNADYVPGALCPRWLGMLANAFADRSESDRAAVIATLQEVLGAALLDVKPRGLHKALVLVGGTNCGKSQLLAVFGGLFGEKQIDQAITSVDTPHGLMPFLSRLPWVLDEAFNQNVWHMSAIVKTLITGESISINIKHGAIVPHRFTGPIFWATNHPPQFKESTRAIVERLVVINCEQKFDELAPVGIGLEAMRAGMSGPAALVLAQERPGVLCWALEGLQRALARGYIATPSESVAAAAQIYRDSNIVAGFVEECVDYDPNGRVSLPDFCVAVAAWFVENKGESRSSPSNESIGRAVVALHDPRIGSDRYELRDMVTRYLVGVRLNSHGLNYHERGISADLFEGKTVQTTTSGGLVNKEIPASWDAKPKVVAMRQAHVVHAEKERKELSCGPIETTVIDETVMRDVSLEVSSPQAVDPSSKPLF